MNWFYLVCATIFFILACVIYYKLTAKNRKKKNEETDDKEKADKPSDKAKVTVVNSSNNQAITIVALVIALLAFVIILFWAPWKKAESSSESKEVVCTIPTYYTFKKGDNRVQTIPIGQHNFSWTVQGGTLKGTNGNKTATITMSAQNEKLHGDLRKLILSAKSFTPGSDEVSLKIVIED